MPADVAWSRRTVRRRRGAWWRVICPPGHFGMIVNGWGSRPSTQPVSGAVGRARNEASTRLRARRLRDHPVADSGDLHGGRAGQVAGHVLRPTRPGLHVERAGDDERRHRADRGHPLDGRAVRNVPDPAHRVLEGKLRRLGQDRVRPPGEGLAPRLQHVGLRVPRRPLAARHRLRQAVRELADVLDRAGRAGLREALRVPVAEFLERRRDVLGRDGVGDHQVQQRAPVEDDLDRLSSARRRDVQRQGLRLQPAHLLRQRTGEVRVPVLAARAAPRTPRRCCGSPLGAAPCPRQGHDLGRCDRVDRHRADSLGVQAQVGEGQVGAVGVRRRRSTGGCPAPCAGRRSRRRSRWCCRRSGRCRRPPGGPGTPSPPSAGAVPSAVRHSAGPRPAR